MYGIRNRHLHAAVPDIDTKIRLVFVFKMRIKYTKHTQYDSDSYITEAKPSIEIANKISKAQCSIR